MVLLILVSVQLSFELSRHEGRIRRLAEEVALLQQQIDALDKAAKEENDDNR
jgi:cell division protein ZapA (FtsZ GTPase activity inhibitor)